MTPPNSMSSGTSPAPFVSLHLLERETHRLDHIPLKERRLQSHAISWTRIVGNRAKWEDLPGEVRGVADKARRLLQELGLDEARLHQLAQARIIEVRIPWTGECSGWEQRILPWEFILICALRNYSQGGPGPVIVRCLDRGGPDDSLPPLRQVRRALGIISCPPGSDYLPAYDKELKIVAGCFADHPGVQFESLPRATRQNIDEQLRRPAGEPVDAIHFQGLEHKGPEKSRSYLWLPMPDGTHACEFEDAARLLTPGGGIPPRLVAYSFCHTGPRLAAYTVVSGAHAAIGFQDLVRDDQYQNFFGCFYRVWARVGWEVLSAFEQAIREVGFTLEGTGVILWLDRSRLGALVPPSAPAARAAETAVPAPIPSTQEARVSPPAAPAEEIAGTRRSGRRAVRLQAREAEASDSPSEALAGGRTVLSPAGALDGSAVGDAGQIPPQFPPLFAPPAPGPAPQDKQVTIRVDARKTINYALLHNQQVNGPKPARRTLFETFSIQRPETSMPFEVDVEVNLYAGDHVGSWRERVSLKLLTTDLAERVHVPLTSVLARSLRESLRTTIETSVSIDGKLLDRRCHPVSLLAIEEWLDDGVCHIWLPSFVLPRDPAVSGIVQRARRCLCALLDDYTAGFDGYQWNLPERVDSQAQALWATLSLEWQLGYINPPPTFSAQSQRLRRPSAILEGAAGTCLDLALLLAACLEYVDIDPVLILAPGHAYVGWWRHEFDQFSYTQDVATTEAGGEAAGHDPGRIPEAAGQPMKPQRASTSWVYGKEAHPAILKARDDGRLKVVETTGLTRHLPFAAALREGDRRLRSRLDFECFVDVKRARQAGITPLPMCL